MRKMMIVVLLVDLLAFPCFANEFATITSSDVVLEQIGKSFAGNTGNFLIALGREKKSPVLLAAAAELFETSEIELDSPEGKVNSASVYAEAVAMAKGADNADLADSLEKQIRIGAGKAFGRFWNLEIALWCYGHYIPVEWGPYGPSGWPIRPRSRGRIWQ
jgi:hypothetical protein